MRPYEPIREIKFAARSGFLTRKLCDKYFSYGTTDWKNKLWARLLTREYFKNHYSRLAPHVLVLNRKNDFVRKLVGEYISSPPFISQLDHDEIVAEIVLWLFENGIISDYKFEIELKKDYLSPDRHYGSETKSKFPDAIIRLRDKKETKIAMELELTKKDPKRYRNIMEAYSSMKGVDKVVFIGRNDSLCLTIRKAMRESYYPDWEKPVGFGSLNDWLENPSQAPIAFSEETLSLISMAKSENRTSS